MQPTTILCVEDNKQVLSAIKETLELEGWRVEVCEDGATALAQIESGKSYELIITDNDLPGVSGLELIRYARTLEHRCRTPIIMLSATACQTEAQRAGADHFLRKPEDMYLVVEIVQHLLARPTPAA
jgi:two-component system chemotaxis response regulator CheY